MSRKPMYRGLIAVATSLFLTSPVTAQTAKKWDLFLLFGQSNMAGAPSAETQDKTTNPRIKALAFNNCTGKTFNQWYVASPPLHGCYEGLGPGDYFAKTLIDTSDKLGLGIDTIGLIPCAISGVDISFFSKGVTSSRRKDFKIPPVDSGVSAYLWMVTRIKEAQKNGVVRGIIFHQGESDWSDTARKAWPGRVEAILKNLKADCGLGDVPFLAGELRYKLNRTTNESCCYAHNTYVAQLAAAVANGGMVSAANLTGLDDAYHFDAAGQRTFGHRYAAAMVPLLKKTMSVDPSVRSIVPGLRIESSLQGLTIHSDAALDRVSLESIQGQVTVVGSGKEVRLLRGQFHPGVYFLRIESGTAMETRKVLIER
jgi:hypothetical protein